MVGFPYNDVTRLTDLRQPATPVLSMYNSSAATFTHEADEAEQHAALSSKNSSILFPSEDTVDNTLQRNKQEL
jgi:hypothetical protein